MERKQTRVRTIRFPADLDERIILLAQKRKWSFSSWVVNTCLRESKPRNPS